jgi:Flp pilus assembly pilin Flp
MRSYLFRCSRARAQSLVEYSLISALVAIVVLATLFLLGPQITSIFQTITNNL